MQFWEDAIKGSSALQAALRRRLMDECAVALGYETASIYWDLMKFYDSVDWVRAIEWSLELGLPPRLLRIAMSIHKAPRIVLVGKLASSPIPIANSLVAGCASAIWIARVMVCSILERTHREGSIRTRNRA